MEEEVTFKRSLKQTFIKYTIGIRNIPLPLIRTVLKASIAVVIALIFVLVNKIRLVVGPASTLVTLGSLLYFPVKPVGVQTKRVFQGVFSAVAGAAWCYLGNFAANAARDDSVESPLQPASSAISAIFVIILMFVLRYVRAKYPQLDFATTFASMIGSFSLTTNANTPGFQPSLTLTYLKPLLFASAICLFVNIFIWPEDSVTKYLDTATATLKEFNLFFQRNTCAFSGKEFMSDHTMTPSSFSNYAGNMSLTTLKNKLRASYIKLIDAQHDIDYAILHHQLEHNDISKITELIKAMHTPLHGIGLSIICKQNEHLADQEKDIKNDLSTFCQQREVEIENLTFDLVLSCKTIIDDCVLRMSANFKEPPRSVWSTFLWPFPRLFKRSTQKLQLMSLESLDELIEKYNKTTHNQATDVSELSKIITEGGIEEKRYQLVQLFQFNVLGYARCVRSFASYINLLNDHDKKKLRLPQVPLKSWFKPSVSNSETMIGGQVSDGRHISESIKSNNASISEEPDTELGSNSYKDSQISSDDEDGYVCAMNRNDRPCPRDPDVDLPTTTSERFFNYLSKIFNWFYSMETIFGLKTAIGFALLSLPAYLPSSVGWYSGWGGQWVANTLIMWMFPMAGTFNFTILFGLLGSCIGALLSIVVWEIVRGNAYGLAVLSFVIMVLFHYMFFTSPVYSFLAIMTQFTYLMVITTGYQQAVGGALTKDTIEMAAGKRLIFVVLGIIAAAILNWIPKPVTGRVELRKSISRTFRDLGTLYGAIFANILASDCKGPLYQMKGFKRLQLSVQRQLNEQTTYLKFSKLEPPLKGKFPFETYKELIEKLSNMADLIEGMAYSAAALDKSWRRNLVQALNEERFDYIACLLAMMRSLSGTLVSKIPLPPYMVSPEDLKEKVDEKLCNIIKRHPEQLSNDTLSSYCAYSVASSKFTDELIAASKCVEKLVGVDNPEKWLLLNS